MLDSDINAWYNFYYECSSCVVHLLLTSLMCSSAVYEAGGHEILVQLLLGSCMRTVANSASTLCNMAGQEIIRSSLLSHGVIQALVEPLKSKDTQVLVSATLCVALLGCDEEARTEVCACLMTVQNAVNFSCLLVKRVLWSLVFCLKEMFVSFTSISFTNIAKYILYGVPVYLKLTPYPS